GAWPVLPERAARDVAATAGLEADAHAHATGVADVAGRYATEPAVPRDYDWFAAGFGAGARVRGRRGGRGRATLDGRAERAQHRELGVGPGDAAYAVGVLVPAQHAERARESAQRLDLGHGEPSSSSAPARGMPA